MSSAKLPHEFYLQDTVTVARSLLGCVLWRRIGRELLAARLVEVEAYLGANDSASHARRGLRSARNESMYLAGGHAYVYFTYGMHWCLNVVTAEPRGRKGGWERWRPMRHPLRQAGAVLIWKPLPKARGSLRRQGIPRPPPPRPLGMTTVTSQRIHHETPVIAFDVSTELS